VDNSVDEIIVDPIFTAVSEVKRYCSIFVHPNKNRKNSDLREDENGSTNTPYRPRITHCVVHKRSIKRTYVRCQRAVTAERTSTRRSVIGVQKPLKSGTNARH
jgi:hypothetical protein